MLRQGHTRWYNQPRATCETIFLHWQARMKTISHTCPSQARRATTVRNSTRDKFCTSSYSMVEKNGGVARNGTWLRQAPPIFRAQLQYLGNPHWWVTRCKRILQTVQSCTACFDRSNLLKVRVTRGPNTASSRSYSCLHSCSEL